MPIYFLMAVGWVDGLFSLNARLLVLIQDLIISTASPPPSPNVCYTYTHEYFTIIFGKVPSDSITVCVLLKIASSYSHLNVVEGNTYLGKTVDMGTIDEGENFP